MDLTQRN